MTQCTEKILNGWRSVACPNKAKFNGKCGIHCDEAKAKRKAKSDAATELRVKHYAAPFERMAREREKFESTAVELATLKAQVESFVEIGEIVCDARTGHIVNIWTDGKSYPKIGTKIYIKTNS